MRRVFRVTALVLLIGLGSIGGSFAQRAIPEDNLAFPVLITVGASQGSGFFVNDGKSIFLVTAKHVLFDPLQNWSLRAPVATLLSYSRDVRDSGRNFLTLDLTKLTAQGVVKAHASEDVAVVKLGVFPENLPPVPPQPLAIPTPTAPPPVAPLKPISLSDGVVVNEHAAAGIVSADVTISAKTFDHVLVGNDVLLFGYPVSLALVPNPKIDFSRPLLRRGIVAGENLSQHSIILDCPSYQGDSGGPVIEVDTVSPFQRSFSIIGVMNSFVPFADTWKNEHFGYSNTTLQNSGYSVITPMDYVLELMK